MNDPMGLGDSNNCSITRGRNETDLLALKGRFHMEHWRDGKLLAREDITNQITDVGKIYLFGVAFNSTTQITTWYIGLVDNAGWTAYAAPDTMSSHTGWVESVAYTQATRVAWGPNAPSGSGTVTIANTVVAAFSMNTNGTSIKGFFLTSVSTKSGTTGTLWSTAAFQNLANVNSGDTINVTYSVAA